MASDPAAAGAEQLLFLDDYELLSTLGEGSHAKVKLGWHLPTGTEVAIKVVPRWGQGRQVQLEARCMHGLRHPNIVQLFEVVDTDEALCLVMELMGRGDLGAHLDTHGRMAEGTARRLFRQLVSAVQYCHGRGVIHRDVKPENIFLDQDGNAKLGDFSLSWPFGPGPLSTCCGTPYYMAPEIFRRGDYAGPPVDVWSLGVVLYKMVTGTLPFRGKNIGEVARRVRKAKYSVPRYLSPGIQRLLRTLLNPHPEERSSLCEVMRDAWLNQGHAGELRPFVEPAREDLDPAVEQEMLALGFAREDIRSSLAQDAYDPTMATYLILAAERPRTPYRTIVERPRGAADPHGDPGPGREAEESAGREVEESAGPSGSPGRGEAAAGRSPPSRRASVHPRAKQMKASVGHSPLLPTPVLRPGGMLRTSPAGAGPKASTAHLRTSRTPGISALPPDRGSCVDVDSDSRPTPPPPGPKDSRSTPPPPGPEDSRPTGPPPGPEDSRPTGPPPGPEDSRPTGPPPMRDSDSRSTPPPPVLDWDSKPTPPPPALDSDSKPTPPPPVLDWDSRPTPPPPALDSDSKPTPPPPVLDSDSRPTPPPPALDSDSKPTPLPPALDSDSKPTPPPPVLDLDSRPTPPPPGPEDSRPTGPPPMRDSDSRATPPPPAPELLRTTPPTLNQEPKDAPRRPAPQYGPGDSPCTHNVNSSSSSSSESAERKHQGRRGLARRCLNFLRQLCCLPAKKGHYKSNQRKPSRPGASPPMPDPDSRPSPPPPILQ